MKRKLIEYGVFERIEKDSLSSAQCELIEAEPILSKALGVEEAHLRCFGPETVVYESIDGSFIHANYKLDKNSIVLENVEQLVIDEQSEHLKSREILSKLFDAVITDQSERADSLFEEYMNLPHVHRDLTEGTIIRRREVRKWDASKGKQVGTGKYKKAREKVLGHHENPGDTNRRTRARKISVNKRTEAAANQRARNRNKIKIHAKVVKEWANLCENVFNYFDYKEYGPALRESTMLQDDRGNVVSVRIPNKNLRNEAKLLSFNWKTLNTDVMVKRSGAKKLAENMDFCKAIANLKRQNALSDNSALEESLENIVTNWSQVLYLTQTELAETIKLALEYVGTSNFDDQVCEFMSEGILRMAHDAYVDRVEKIVRLSGSKIEETANDKYASFKMIVNGFYAHLDESNQLEMQVFVDLYEALRQVHEATKDSDQDVAKEAASHLYELLPIVQQEAEAKMEVAEAAAEWLYNLVETNLETQDWKVTNSVHTTTNGDHPAMSANARQGYTPSSDFSGNWGDPAPVSDGNSYKNGMADEMRSRSWGNVGDETYPELDNPYTLKPFGDYKIKGEKHIDADSDHLAHWSSGDTWPNLANPYVPKAVEPKMKSDDLVVDK